MTTRVRIVLNDNVTGVQRKLLVRPDWTVGQFMHKMRGENKIGRHQALLFTCCNTDGREDLPPVSKLMAELITPGQEDRAVHCSLRTHNTFG